MGPTSDPFLITQNDLTWRDQEHSLMQVEGFANEQLLKTEFLKHRIAV